MISSRFAICAAAAAVALSLSACSTVDLDKDKAGSITDGTSVEEALSSKTGPLAKFTLILTAIPSLPTRCRS